MRGQLEQQTAGLTRTQMKRALFDQLAAGHSFEVPGTMIEAEFAQIWAQLQEEAARDEDPAAALKQIDDEKDEYRAIAERRVRLGLLLSEIGQSNGVEITSQEMSMLIQQAAMQYRPEDRERFVTYIQSEPMAAAQMRAPLYEDKVVDFLFDKAEVTTREVTAEELQAAIEVEEPADAAPALKKAPAKKKSPPKKAEVAAEEAPAAEDKPAPKKAPAKKRTPNAAFMKALTPSAALAAVIGHTAVPRTEVVSKMWTYIKKHGLQDKVNKRNINADDKLKQVFGKAQVTMFELAGLIGKHLK
jgi:trigger factor